MCANPSAANNIDMNLLEVFTSHGGVSSKGLVQIDNDGGKDGEESTKSNNNKVANPCVERGGPLEVRVAADHFSGVGADGPCDGTVLNASGGEIGDEGFRCLRGSAGEGGSHDGCLVDLQSWMKKFVQTFYEASER